MAVTPEQGVPAVEREIADAALQGDFARATTLIVKSYGPAIIGFLRTRLYAEAEVSDVFSEFAEDLWRGLPTLSFRSTARAWAFTLARNAAHRYSRAPERKRRRLSGPEPLEELVEQVRETTLVHLRTEVKTRIQQLREQLDPDEQALLVLRVDRGLSWQELALVLEEATQDVDEAELTRAAARARKRFQRAKARLRELAIADGLIPSDPAADIDAEG